MGVKLQVVPVFLEVLDSHITDNMVQSGLGFRLYGRVSDRLGFGMRKYGVPLTTNNGKDALQEAWEEACDGSQYLVQAYCEGRLKNAQLMHDQIQLLLKIEEELARGTETDNEVECGTAEEDEQTHPLHVPL
jgi:hypothetical protein